MNEKWKQSIQLPKFGIFILKKVAIHDTYIHDTYIHDTYIYDTYTHDTYIYSMLQDQQYCTQTLN